MSFKDSFIAQSFIFILGSFSLHVLNFFYQLLMGRMLGPEEYAIVAALFSIIYIIGAPAGAVQVSIAKFTASLKTKKKSAEINYFMRSVTKKAFLISIAVFILMIILSPLIKLFLNLKNLEVLLLFSLIGFTVLIAALRGLLQGLQKFRTLSINLVTEGVAKVAFAFIFVLIGLKAFGAILGLQISLFITILFIIFLFWENFKNIRKFKINKKEIFSFSSFIILIVSLFSILYSFDILFVKHHFDAIVAGLYSAASIVAKISLFASMAIAYVLLPKVAEKRTCGLTGIKTLKKALALTTIICLAYILLTFVAPEFILTFLYGIEYLSAAKYILPLAIASLFISLDFVFLHFFIAHEKIKVIYLIIVTSALFSILLYIAKDIEFIINSTIFASILLFLLLFSYYIFTIHYLKLKK